MKISYFSIAVQFIVWSGFLTPCLMKKNAWGGRDSWDFTRDFFLLINQSFWWFEVLSAVLEAVTNETCYKVFFFFFSGQYLKDLTLISQGNSGLPQSKKKIIIEKEWAGIVLIPELYSIHLKLIFFLLLQLNWIHFSCMFSRK